MKKIILLFLLLLWAQLVFSYHNHYRPRYERPRYPQYHDYHKRPPQQPYVVTPEVEEEIPFDQFISPPVLLRKLELHWQNDLFKISIYDKYDVYSGKHIEQGINVGVKF